MTYERFLCFAAGLILLLLGGCVMPGTHARVAWNPASKQFEGELSRSWMAGPVDLECTTKSPDGTEFTIRWHSVADLESSSRAYTAQTEALKAAVEAAAKIAAPIPLK